MFASMCKPGPNICYTLTLEFPCTYALIPPCPCKALNLPLTPCNCDYDYIMDYFVCIWILSKYSSICLATRTLYASKPTLKSVISLFSWWRERCRVSLARRNSASLVCASFIAAVFALIELLICDLYFFSGDSSICSSPTSLAVVVVVVMVRVPVAQLFSSSALNPDYCVSGGICCACMFVSDS